MKKTLWALMDDRNGSVGQARGILQALGTEYHIIEKKIVYNRFAALPNCLLGASLLGVNRLRSDSLEADYPDYILSISRRTTPIARYLKKQSRGKSKIIQLMFPGRAGLSELDLVVVPEHDRPRAETPNFLHITGCPHRVTATAMAEARQKWEPVFASLPKPWTTVIIGGAIKKKPFSVSNARLLAEQIRALKKQIGGSLLITTSRRTGKVPETIIREALQDIPSYTYWWGETKENPIMGFWACAEQIIVTGDTVSMCCESCGSGRPVLIFSGKNWLTPKHYRFVESLFSGGFAVSLDNPNALEFKPQKSLNPSAEIAAAIHKLD